MKDEIGIYLTHSAHQQVEGEEWEKRLRALDPRIKVLNPFKKDIGSTHQEAYDKAKQARRDGTEMTEDIMTAELSDALVDSDLEGLRKQDILVCIFPPKEYHTAGGICEMFYASRILNMPVFTYAPPHLIHHPWIISHSDIRFDHIDTLFEFLAWFMENEHQIDVIE